VNAAGGVLGRKLETIFRDDAGKPEDSVRLAGELINNEKVDLISGAFLSNIGLALSDFANQNKRLYVASEPLTDALVWSKGNRYTFRLRPSTYMQAAMLVEEAAKLPAKRWATVAPNYEYGQSAVKWFFNVTFGADLTNFVRQGNTRGLFEGRAVVSMLTGEPEYLDPLGGEAPAGWIVTGYPHADLATPEHVKFRDAYRAKYNDYPRLGSVVGYDTVNAIAAMLAKAGSTETEKMIEAMRGVAFTSPFGPVTFRSVDHQATLGAFVGRIAVKDGKGTMVDWVYRDGAKYLPDDATVRAMRPQG
jgi:branched-chain amino acid transport system substrate-binding protein